MAKISLKCGTRLDYCNFVVEARICEGDPCFFLMGEFEVAGNWRACHSIYCFVVENENDYAVAFHESCKVFDMLQDLLGLLDSGTLEPEALQTIAEKYPEHFKYLAKLGYQSPVEGGGA